MKTIRIIAILLVAMMVSNLSQAQKLIKKELQTENKEEDGFVYRWYLYTYLSGQDTLYAAFDLAGNRITPNSDYILTNTHRGFKPHYCGGGMFMYRMKKKDATGEYYYIFTGYNMKGELIFPESMDLTFIFYEGDDIFKVYKSVDSEGLIEAAYNSRGEYIIPFSVGCDYISWNGDYNRFWCKIKSGSDEIHYTYTRDGQYFAEGYYNLNDPKELEKFNQHKRRAPWSNSRLTSGSSSTTARSSYQEPSSSSTTTNTSTNNSQTQTRQPQPMQVWVPCYMCHGSGQCQTCMGQGWLGTATNPRKCWNCGGTGKCTTCGGHAGHNEIQYR